MSKRGSAQKSCTDKRRYRSSDEAHEARVGLIRRTGTAPMGLRIYGCGKGAGKHWHIGHMSRAYFGRRRVA